MALPVKTLILKAIEAALQGVSQINTVLRNPPTQPKREVSTYPVACVYDDTEGRTANNRYSNNSFPVQIEVYYNADEQDASDVADLIDSGIYTAMLKDKDILSLVKGIKCEEGEASKKGFIDEFTAVLICRYVVSYQHAYGDPTAPMRTP
jgi:hypothetical protein